MNKAELKAITMIASKMNWMHKPVCETMETIKKMVSNQQALELDTIGECDDFEETLLSIALWDKERITSTMFVSDYFSLANWNCYINSGWDDITFEDFCAQMYWSEVKANILAEEYELEEMAKYDAYCDAWENSYC